MFASPQITESNGRATVSYGNDASLYPVFTIEAIKDDEASIEAGRDIYKDVEWLTIHFAGNNLTKVSRPVTPEDKMRFAPYYQAFKNQNIQLNTGTPLTEWSLVSKALAMTLKSSNIHTVEQLAAVADVNLTWMGARELQQKAQTWLESSEKNAGFSKIQEENEQLRRDMKAMQNQMTALMAEKKIAKKQKVKEDE